MRNEDRNSVSCVSFTKFFNSPSHFMMTFVPPSSIIFPDSGNNALYSVGINEPKMSRL